MSSYGSSGSSSPIATIRHTSSEVKRRVVGDVAMASIVPPMGTV